MSGLTIASSLIEQFSVQRSSSANISEIENDSNNKQQDCKALQS